MFEMMKKLSGHESSDCRIILWDDEKAQSKTTRRQITWFLREYYPQFDLQDMKRISGKGFVSWGEMRKAAAVA